MIKPKKIKTPKNESNFKFFEVEKQSGGINGQEMSGDKEKVRVNYTTKKKSDEFLNKIIQKRQRALPKPGQKNKNHDDDD